MATLNLGILAHVDAGKTTLTERLLHTTGAIAEFGSVDQGSTQTDTLELERQRGITIKSAVVSFVVDDLTVNLIDTPGHPDFIAEVERVLSVLDGAVLVISAVAGVQPQSRVLMRALQRLRIPTLIFVNKIDSLGADVERAVQSITDKLTPAVVPMGTVSSLGTAGARFVPHTRMEGDHRGRLVDLLTVHDESLLSLYVENEAAVSSTRLRSALAAQTKNAVVHPVFLGSAMTGAGVDDLLDGISKLLPSGHGDADSPVSGTVFKIERGFGGEKIAYARLFTGTVRTRDRLQLPGGAEGKVTAISVVEPGSISRRSSVVAGQIGKLWGLADVRVGDSVGELGAPEPVRQFAPPTFEAVVVPSRAADRGALHVALSQLAEQDPLINLRRDESGQEIVVSLYGEVQKEVIQATLADDFGIVVTFRETTIICIERPVGTGEAVEFKDADGNPFLATVGLRVEPAPIGAGSSFRLGVELGSMPYSFFRAVEETVTDTLRQGLYGWQVLDCTITMTHSGYFPRQSHAHQGFDKSMSSTAGDFRNVTPLVLVDALTRAGTQVYEPMHRFVVEVPENALRAVTPVLVGLGGVPEAPIPGGSSYTILGQLPAARIRELEQRLPALTNGEGVLESSFSHYQPVRGIVPNRPRTDNNPLNRKEYLLRVAGHL